MKTIEQKAEDYYKSLVSPLPNAKALVVTSYCVGAENALIEQKQKLKEVKTICSKIFEELLSVENSHLLLNKTKTISDIIDGILTNQKNTDTPKAFNKVF